MNKLFGSLVGSAACTVQLELRPSCAAVAAGGGVQPTVSMKNRREELETMPLFCSKDTIAGEVKVTPIPGKRADHQGIRVQLLGEVELASERGHPHQFLSLGAPCALHLVQLDVRDLAPPGDLATQVSLPFEFGSVEMQYESYRGTQAQVRYLLRVTVARSMGQSVAKDHAFWVRNTQSTPPPGPSIKMEVGIEDCLHIEFEYERGAYHMHDTVLGRIHFLLVRIKLKHMELEIRRRETSGAGAAAKSESETVAKYEIMDGAPVRGESIPIRLSLRPYELSPSYANVFNKFSVRYFLNLVLVDEEDRRYFKQQEITLYRLGDEEDEAPASRLPRRMLSLPPALSGPTSPSAAAAAAAATAAHTMGPAATLDPANGGMSAAAPPAAAAAAPTPPLGRRARGATEGHLIPSSSGAVGGDNSSGAADAAAAVETVEEDQPLLAPRQQPGPAAAASSPLGNASNV